MARFTPRHAARSFLAIPIRDDGSLFLSGSLKLDGSLRWCGSLGTYGSLAPFGSLKFYGSLVASGALDFSGSLTTHGSLRKSGSLRCFGSLHPSRLSLDRMGMAQMGNRVGGRWFLAVVIPICRFKPMSQEQLRRPAPCP